MKNNFYKKLLSIILTAMLILATIPFSCISVLAEEAGVPVLYASQIPNNTHLTLNSDTELIMDENWATLWVKSGGGDNMRSVKLRKKPSTGQWFLNDIQCLSDIRVPASEDPWA